MVAVRTRAGTKIDFGKASAPTDYTTSPVDEVGSLLKEIKVKEARAADARSWIRVDNSVLVIGGCVLLLGATLYAASFMLRKAGADTAPKPASVQRQAQPVASPTR